MQCQPAGKRVARNVNNTGKRNFFFSESTVDQMSLILTNSGALNSNVESEFCYYVKVLRCRVSHNFMVSVTATENNT